MEGLKPPPTADAIDWRGNDWTPEIRDARRAPERALQTPGAQCPCDRGRVRRTRTGSRSPRSCSAAGASVVPLVLRGARLGARRVPRLDALLETPPPPRARSGDCAGDPMAMLPFCGYHMADYFRHWLALGRRKGEAAADLPRQLVPQGRDGKLIWPGYGENSRVLAWIFRRCRGRAEAVETKIGLLPPVGQGGIETAGSTSARKRSARLLEVDVEGWKRQVPQMHGHYAVFGDRLPAGCTRNSTHSTHSCIPSRSTLRTRASNQRQTIMVRADQRAQSGQPTRFAVAKQSFMVLKPKLACPSRNVAPSDK